MLTALQQSFWDRLAGVVMLQRPAYEAIQRDPEATGQSWLIVVLLGLANGIAIIITGAEMVPAEFLETTPEFALIFTFETNESRMLALAGGVASAVIVWYLSSWLLRVIGNRLAGKAGQQVEAEEMRRLVAWGYSPSLASFLAPIPLVGPILATLGSLWAFVTGVMAIRAAFDIGVWRAVTVGVAAYVLMFLAVIVVLTVLMLAWPLA